MAEENTVTMTVENVDRLFSEIVVNGESHVSENYVPPVQMEHTSPQSAVQEEEPSVPAPAQAVQGQDVYAVELNEVLHDFSDRDLTQSLADEVSARQQADSALQDSVSTIQNKIPSEATSTNKLADKAFVGTSISDAVNALDASSVGGNNKYIKSISEADGVISATEGSIDTEVTDGSSNPVTSDAVYDAIQESKGDSIKTYPTMADLEQDLPNLAEGQIVATEEGDAFTTVDTVQSGVFNPVTSNAVAEALSTVEYTEEISGSPVASLSSFKAFAVTTFHKVKTFVVRITNISGSNVGTTSQVYVGAIPIYPYNRTYAIGLDVLSGKSCKVLLQDDGALYLSESVGIPSGTNWIEIPFTIITG